MATVGGPKLLPVTADGPSVTLTIRLIMQGKEVGSIIGKKGDNIKRFREESGAKINISDGSCPERIVTITGSTDNILRAFSLVAQKFEEDLQTSIAGTNVPKPPVTLRLIVPASQCGSLIGKSGSKIKEIREATGASIQVASEMLPNSTERAVTVSGTAEAITKCIYQICYVMMESPPKGATIPYRPKPAVPPLIFAGGQAYAVQGQYAIPHPDLTKLHQLALQHAPLLPGHNVGTLNPQAWAALASTNGLRPGATGSASVVGATTTSEMTIPNDLIGCVIGKGGVKINEIRQISGAVIKVANPEDGSKDRLVTITGTPESINFAQYLINASMDRQSKNMTLDLTSTPVSSHSMTSANLSSTPSPLAISLSQLVKATPLALGLTPATVTTASNPTSALFATAEFKHYQAKNLSNKLRVAAPLGGSKKPERNKFTPY